MNNIKKLLALWLLALLTLLSACASAPTLVTHQFTFSGHADKWAQQVDLLEYSYGDQYHMVRDSVDKPQYPLKPGQTLPKGTGVNGPMPVGEFLFVKWRLNSSGEVLQERVDLRPLLPRDMSGHTLTFVIDGRQLYVYLVTPKAKKTGSPPILRTYLSQFTETYELHPTNTYPRQGQ